MDAAEYERIADKYLNSVYKAVYAYCHKKESAEDAVQNAFIKLYENSAEFTDDDHIKRWLIRVAINECKNGWLSFRSRNVISIEDITEEPTYTQNEQSALWDILAKLPQNYRAVIHLYYYEGFSVRETAEILNISESNAQNRLMRARNKLKDLLEKESLL